MDEPFSHTFTVGWEHLDANTHLKNTAYLDLAVNTRLLCFEQNGFPRVEFERQHFGPVVRRDELEYFREFRLGEVVRVTCAIAGMSSDGSRYQLRNEFFRPDGKLAARINTVGGWMDLETRKLSVPPDGLASALLMMDHTDDFQLLESSVD